MTTTTAPAGTPGPVASGRVRGRVAATSPLVRGAVLTVGLLAVLSITRQLSGAAHKNAAGKRVRYAIRAINSFKTELFVARPWVTITAG